MMTDPIAPMAKEALIKPPDPDATARMQRLQGACVDFESMLIQQMFQSMQESLPQGSLVGSGLSGSVYSSILTQAVAKSMAEKQSVGLASQLFQDMIRRNPDLKAAHERAQAERANGAASGTEPPIGDTASKDLRKKMVTDALLQMLDIGKSPGAISVSDSIAPLETPPKADK